MIQYEKGFLLITVLLTVLVSACATGNEDTPGRDSNDPGDDVVRIEADDDDSGRLLRFYFGSFLGGSTSDSSDPVEAGILEKRENSWYLRAPVPDELDSSGLLTNLFSTAMEEGLLTEDLLGEFVQRHYYDARGFPETLAEWTSRNEEWSEPEWFRIEVQGSMVPQRRITWVNRSNIEYALDSMQSLDDPVLYPGGTVFVGEHLRDGVVEETTLMRKRSDGFWDYWAYDAEGKLTDVIRKEPRDMLIPTRCTGCHYGDRQFEPERSFPATAQPGPSGERALYIPESWRRSDVASALQEHARRSDTILGLYATLYLAEAAAGSSPTPETGRRFLERFGIETSPQ